MKHSRTIRNLICKHITGHLYNRLPSLNHNQTGVYMIGHCMVCNEYEVRVTSLQEEFKSLYTWELSKGKTQK